MKRLFIAVSVAMLALSASGCGSTDKSVDPPPDVLATVADEPITVEQVRALTSADPLPPVLVAGGYSGQWREALELAIRNELLAREAARRGIDAPTRAQQIAAFIEKKQHGTAGLTVEGIPEDEARTWYREHRSLFGEVENVDVAWAEFSSGTRAKKTLEQVARADQPTFLRLVREHGAAKTGTATIDHRAESTDPMIARGAFAIGAAGGVGLSADPQNNQWWVVRVERISFQQLDWDEALSYRVRSAMAAYRQDEQLRRLADSLRKKWQVHVYEARLAEVITREELR